MRNKAKIIAFSGIDGCGKSTQLKLIKDQLSTNHSVYVSKLSYMPLDDMNNNKFQDLLLMGKSGIEILKYFTELQTEDIYKYDYILCDRHIMCYLAYAYAYGIKRIEVLRKLLFLIKNPDLTLYFDIDVNTSLERIKSRGKVINKHENFHTLLKAKEGYKKLLPLMGDVEVINANKSIEEMQNDINKALVKRDLL